MNVLQLKCKIKQKILDTVSSLSIISRICITSIQFIPCDCDSCFSSWRVELPWTIELPCNYRGLNIYHVHSNQRLTKSDSIKCQPLLHVVQTITIDGYILFSVFRYEQSTHYKRQWPLWGRMSGMRTHYDDDDKISQWMKPMNGF